MTHTVGRRKSDFNLFYFVVAALVVVVLVDIVVVVAVVVVVKFLALFPFFFTSGIVFKSKFLFE